MTLWEELEGVHNGMVEWARQYGGVPLGSVFDEMRPHIQRVRELEAELATLQDKRVQVINEMSRAAADKDFRENAPLQAAREQYGHLEGRIQEVEEDLKSAVIIKEKTEANRQVAVGDSVVLSDLVSGEEWRYMIVSPNEVDPTKGKISSASPLGKAIVGQRPGEIVEIKAPAGKLSYRLKQIGR